MTTECTQVGFEFHSLNHRQIRVQFDGGAISSDGGSLLLREVDKRTGIMRKFAACFTDYRDPERIEHRLEELLAQRVYGLALGYEDLNDHDQLRNDPLLAVLVEKSDPSQEVLAGKSTLNRLELTPATATAQARYKKIVLDHGAVDRLLVDLFLEAHGEAPQQIILDLDATDDPLYGKQEGLFFTATTDTTAICHCTSSAEGSCCARACGRPISMGLRAAWQSYSGSCPRFDRYGRRFASSSAGTRDSAVRN